MGAVPERSRPARDPGPGAGPGAGAGAGAGADAGPGPGHGPGAGSGSGFVSGPGSGVDSSLSPDRGPSPDPAPGNGPGPLLIACALRIERLALAQAERARKVEPPAEPAPVSDAPVTVVRTGMGPRSARRSVALALRAEPVPGRTAVLATGFCAGLVPGMRPGDLIVADVTRDLGDPTAITRCTGTEALAKSLTELIPGSAVHIGPLACADHVVHGDERAALRAVGTIAVDMESAAALRTAGLTGSRPVAAVRVVVDAPGHELVRFGTLRGGITAFRVLRAALPAFYEWRRSQPLPWR